MFATIGGIELFFAVVIIVVHAMIGIVMVSGVKFSRSMTFLLTCIGTVIFESFFYMEIAARHYCPDYNSAPFELQTLHCYQKYNNHTL